jgi:thymidine kinase
MAKLYFKYGAMARAKQLRLLITRFNYEERGMKVWLIKRHRYARRYDHHRSRIGIEGVAENISPMPIFMPLSASSANGVDVVIADECQFFTESQIDTCALSSITTTSRVVFRLAHRFPHQTIPGQSAPFELSDSITEIKTICACGTGQCQRPLRPRWQKSQPSASRSIWAATRLCRHVLKCWKKMKDE